MKNLSVKYVNLKDIKTFGLRQINIESISGNVNHI